MYSTCANDTLLCLLTITGVSFSDSVFCEMSGHKSDDPLSSVVDLFFPSSDSSSDSEQSDESKTGVPSPRTPPSSPTLPSSPKTPRSVSNLQRSSKLRQIMSVLPSISRGATYDALCYYGSEPLPVLSIPMAYLVTFDGIDYTKGRHGSYKGRPTRSSGWIRPIVVQSYVRCRQRDRKSLYDLQAVVVSCVKQVVPKSMWSFVVWNANKGAKVFPACQVIPDEKQDKCTGADWVLAKKAGTKVLEHLAEKVGEIIKKSASNSKKKPVITKFCPHGHSLRRMKHQDTHHCDNCFTQTGINMLCVLLTPYIRIP